MKKILYIMFIGSLMIPIGVNANIMCNDGTISASCTDCHTGCCSRHGGCTDNPNNGGGGYSNNNYGSEPAPAPAPTPAPEPEPTPVPEIPAEQSQYDDTTDSNDNITDEDNDTDYNYYQSDLNSEDNKEEDPAAGLGVLGLLAAGLGVGYKVMKK